VFGGIVLLADPILCTDCYNAGKPTKDEA